MSRTRTPTITAIFLASGCTFNAGGMSNTDVFLGTEPSTASSDGGDTDDSSDTGDASTTTGTSGEDDDSSGSSSSSTGDTTGEPVPLCGNGKLDPGEDCDGELVPEVCAALDPSFTGGTVVCADDCTFDTSACEVCAAPEVLPCDEIGDDAPYAMEMGCLKFAGWQASDATALSSWSVESTPAGHRTPQQFGTHPQDALMPRAGQRAFVMSTGLLPVLDQDGILKMPKGSAATGSDNGNAGTLPEDSPIRREKGGVGGAFADCDGIHDCSNTVGLHWKLNGEYATHNLITAEFALEVPGGTYGYGLDLMYLPGHYPQGNHIPNSDMLVVWQSTEDYVGNIAYMIWPGEMYRPVTLPDLVASGWMVHDGKTSPALQGTGFDGEVGNEGGASKWLTLRGPVRPNETLHLAIALFDMGDAFGDTIAMFDNFRFTCESCDLRTDCGLSPAAD